MTHRMLTAVVAAITLAPFGARAERVWDVHAIGEVTTGYSDNIASAPNNPPPDVAPRDDAAFSTLAPGIFALVDSPRATHELVWTLEGTFVVGADVGESLASRAEWSGLFRPTRKLTIRTNAQWLHGYFTQGLLPSVGGNDVISFPGGSQVSSISAEESLGYELVTGWRVLQYASLSGYTQLSPLPDGGGIDAGGGTGLERAWEHLALGATAGVSYTDFSAPGPTGAENQLTWRTVGFIRKDLGERTSTRLEAGAVGVVGTDGMAGQNARPVADLAASRTVGEAGSLLAAVGRDVRPNLYLGHTIQRDRALVAFQMPLPWGRDGLTRKVPFTIGLVATVAQARAFDLIDGGLSEPWMLYQVSGGGAWTPRDDLRVGVRYEYTEQTRDPMLGTLFLPFSRNLVMLSVWGRYPREPDARGRARMPQRIDRVDETFLDPDQSDSEGRTE